jgi:hypothetical protein
LDAIAEIAMEDLPPKTLKTQLVRLDNNLKQIERNRFAGIQRAPGSLPVLEAFQEFLDNERKKTRRRMIALSACFVLLLLLTAGAGIGVVYWQMKGMAVESGTVSAKTEALRERVAAADEATRTSLAALESQFATNSQSMVQRHAQLLSAQDAMAAQVIQGGESMTAMQDVLDRLASENTALKEDLDRVMKDWPTVAKQVQELQALSMPAVEAAAAPTVAAAPAASTPRPTPRPTTGSASVPRVVPAVAVQEPVSPAVGVTLTIVPPGEALGMRWRLPAIPE